MVAWSQRVGVAVVAWHVDAGVSGASELGDRPALALALADLPALDAGVMVIARRDRLARDVVVSAAIARAVGRAGARIVSADGVGNGDSPADEFMRTVIDGAAAYERSLIRARTRAALQAKRARGERAGAVPYGYDATPTGVLVPHDNERAVIARIHALRASGMSLRQVVAALTAEGLVSRTGRALGLTQVARLVRRAG
jgi:DNA invertase Pin-like site-specific DNA recombinase